MNKDDERDLTGHPSDYGSRTLEEERRRSERGETGGTADGEPLEERGTADSADTRTERGK